MTHRKVVERGRKSGAMIYGYVIEFPLGAHPSGEVPGPSVQLISSTEWEPSCQVYKYEKWNGQFLYFATTGDLAHRSEITLPVVTEDNYRVLFRLVHKTGSAVDDLPWFSSNNVLLYHGPQNVHDKTSKAYRPMLIKIVGHDGNEDDPADAMVYVSYGGTGWAVIKAVTHRLEEGFVNPPSEMKVIV